MIDSFPSRLFQKFDQAIHVPMKIWIGADHDAMTVRQIVQTWRQLINRWNGSPAHQHRNDWNVPFQRRLNFDSNEIPRVFEPGLALTPPFFHPLPSDDREEHLTLGHLRIEVLPKSTPGGIESTSLKIVPEPNSWISPIIDAPGNIDAILTSIRNQDFAHRLHNVNPASHTPVRSEPVEP